MSSLVFITGNKGKLAEVTAILGDSAGALRLTSLKMDLPELQGPTAEYIVREKAKLAFREARNALKAQEGDESTAVMIEDTCLSFDCMGGNLPGPYIKWFLDGVGVKGLYKMAAALHAPSDENGKKCIGPRAVASCIFTVAFSEDDIRLFEGTCEGTIVQPRGDQGFGWDPIFEPTEQSGGEPTGESAHGKKTFAEMSAEEKNKISHRSKALAALKEFFSNDAAAVQKRNRTEE